MKLFWDITKRFFSNKPFFKLFLINKKFKIKVISNDDISTFTNKMLPLIKNNAGIIPESLDVLKIKKIVSFVWHYNFLKHTKPGYVLSAPLDRFTSFIIENQDFLKLTRDYYPEVIQEISVNASTTSFLANILFDSRYATRGSTIYTLSADRSNLFMAVVGLGLEFNHYDYIEMKKFTDSNCDNESFKYEKQGVWFTSRRVFQYLVDHYESLPEEMQLFLAQAGSDFNKVILEEKLRNLEAQRISTQITNVVATATVNKKQKI